MRGGAGLSRIFILQFFVEVSRHRAVTSSTHASRAARAMKTVAFFNNKGGVGKTTLLCNVAACFSHELRKKVCVVDADPQCNATQYLFDEKNISEIYEKRNSFTIFNVIEPLSLGEGFNKEIHVRTSKRFGIDVITGDPRLALTEDLLARDWNDAKAGEIRGIKTSLVFSELASRLEEYDYVFFDVSPSLGALNRSVMLSSEYFMSPLSLDIFSLKAFENISTWLNEWTGSWRRGIKSAKQKNRGSLPDVSYYTPKFVGYVTQQYLAKRDGEGERRAVNAYEKIRQRIDGAIKLSKLDKGASNPFQIGTVPNLFSLIPMSQSAHAPVFLLNSKDGVRGAHFRKVSDAKGIFLSVASELEKRTS